MSVVSITDIQYDDSYLQLRRRPLPSRYPTSRAVSLNDALLVTSQDNASPNAADGVGRKTPLLIMNL